MKKQLFILLSLTFLLGNCCKTEEKPFYDENVSNHAWALQEVKDANDNIIIEKPDSLPQDIYLFFTNDFKVIGHIVSFTIYYNGDYSLDKEGNFVITDLRYPKLPICCEWDQYFLDNYKSIARYEYDSNRVLTLYFENDNKFIFKSK